MASYECRLTKQTKGLMIKDDFINILLLGETGVGKSTIINSFVNYLTYGDFKKAEKEKLVTLIPSKCKVKDKNNEYHIIQIGPEEDQNECLDTGMSATQDVKSYVFPIWNGTLKVRLIDTPGIGDVRGIGQDNINCENILNYIGQLHELHAICYLFKPTNPRITVYFDYCMTQILSRLDKSASNNIIFIFTNTRGTDYGPGDTFPSLQKVIDGIKNRPPHVDIPLNKNMFCFDNESFRYLAAVNEGIEFDNSVRHRNYESWKNSFEQCNKLIKYIVGDRTTPPLKPHFIKSTSAINEARRLIMQLSQPLADISQLISDNIFALQRHQEDLDLESENLDELRQKLYMPVIDLDVIKLTQPVTVCASRKCAEIYKVGETSKWHYKQMCHNPCFLKNVPKEVVGSPELIKCAAIDSTTNTCIKCHCDFSIHMHVYYMTKTVENKIVDNNVKQNINNKEKLLLKVNILISSISLKKDELLAEHKTIVRTCAKFAHFLQNNAIAPVNDSYKEYIEYLIIRERSLGTLTKMSVVHHLQKLLQEYEESKQSFNEALLLQKKIGETDVLITPQKIQDSIQELYKLKHNGKKIKELFESQKKSRIKEYKNSEYVHEVLKQFDDDKNNTEDCHMHTKKYTKSYQKKQYKISDAKGNQRYINHQRVRNYSQAACREENQPQAQSRVRDHSAPPSYHNQPNATQFHPSQPSYNHQGHPGAPYLLPTPHYPQYHNPHYPRTCYPPENYSAHHNYQNAPPQDYGCNPNACSSRCSDRGMGDRNRHGTERDTYEIKVVMNKHENNQPMSSGNNYPPHSFPPQQPMQQPLMQQDLYPPGASSQPYHGGPPQYHGHGRIYDNYQSQGNSYLRPQHSEVQNRPNNRGYNYSNKRGGGFRGGRGTQNSCQKVPNQRKNCKNVNGSSSSDSD